MENFLTINKRVYSSIWDLRVCYMYVGLSDIQNINRIFMIDQLIFYLMIYKWSSSLHLPINYSRSKSLLCIVKITYLMLGSSQKRLKDCVKSTKTSSDLPTKRLFSLFTAVAVNSNDSDRKQVSLVKLYPVYVSILCFQK